MAQGIFLWAIALGSGGWLLGAETAAAPRPAHWAQPLEIAGAPNLHRVSAQLYRSAQPTSAGMRALEQLGIRTVINLRTLHSDRDELRGTRLAYRHWTLQPWHVERKELVEFLRMFSSATNLPVLVHCQRGADRTGLLCATYRIAIQGWSRDEAIREMTGGGFGFYEGWENLVRLLKKMDVDDLRRRAGLAPLPRGRESDRRRRAAPRSPLRQGPKRLTVSGRSLQWGA